MVHFKYPTTLILLALITLIVTACTAPTPAPTPLPPTATTAQGVTVLQPVALNEFDLLDSKNKPIHLSELKGKFWMVTFGYTHCPDVCPINLGNFVAIKNMLKDDAAKLNFVFVSVDGARDTPQVLDKHLALFDASFIGITGKEPGLEPMLKDFKVVYKLEKTVPDQMEYNVSHTASSFLVDAAGRLRRIYAYATKPDIIVADIRQALQEK